MKTQLNLKFKGERTYIQGPDIFNGTMCWLTQQHAPEKISKIDFSFHSMARNTLELHDSKQEGRGDPVAECSYLAGSDPLHGYLYDSGEPILDRYPYDEDLICRDFQVDIADKSGTLGNFSGKNHDFTEIEIWVALTKALHQQSLPEIKGKWLFVRSRFPAYLQKMNYKERRLQIVSNFQNRLTRTMLYGDGNVSGEIFFSIV